VSRLQFLGELFVRYLDLLELLLECLLAFLELANVPLVSLLQVVTRLLQLSSELRLKVLHCARLQILELLDVVEELLFLGDLLVGEIFELRHVLLHDLVEGGRVARLHSIQVRNVLSVPRGQLVILLLEQSLVLLALLLALGVDLLYLIAELLFELFLLLQQ